MKKLLCTATLVCLLFMTGCGKNEITADSNSLLQNNTSGTAVFVSGMGCSNPDCTDISHHHDCPSDCADYDHHHNCSLDCTEASHHHRGTSEGNESGQHHQEEHHGGNHH